MMDGGGEEAREGGEVREEVGRHREKTNLGREQDEDDDTVEGRVKGNGEETWREDEIRRESDHRTG